MDSTRAAVEKPSPPQSEKEDSGDEEVEEEETPDQKKLRLHYESHLVKGVVLTPKELRHFVSKKKLTLRHETEFLKNLSYKYKAVALRKAHRKPKHWVGMTLARFGGLFVDFASFKPRWAKWNRGVRGMILGIEGLSQVMQVHLVPDKSATSYKEAIRSFVDFYEGGLDRILTDKEPALSRKMERAILKPLGIKLVYLQGHSKSFLAETMISYVKRRVSIALEATKEIERRKAKEQGRKMTPADYHRLRNWVDFVPGIVNDFNNRVLPGTKVKRGSVSQHRFLHAIKALYRTETPLNLLSLGIPGKNWPKGFKNKLFKYRLAAKVNLAWRAYYRIKSGFHKPSEKGSYHPKVFVVCERLIKTNRKGVLIPVYRIKGEDDQQVLESIVYPSELVAAKYLKRKRKSGEEDRPDSSSTTTPQDSAGDD